MSEGPSDVTTPEALMSDALTRHRNGDLDGALDLYRRLIDLSPERADPWHLAGAVAHQRGEHELAQSLMEKAVALDNSVADYHSNLGLALAAQGEEAAAVDALEHALMLDPSHAKALINLGGLERRRGNFARAVEVGQRAVAAAPADRDTHNNLGNALKDTGNHSAAIDAYRQAIVLAPDFALAHWNLSLALLAVGELADGFAELAWRWQWSGFPAVKRDFGVPRLQPGDDVQGQTILLHPEQGLGDTIQFLRYVPMMAARAARVILECPTGLAPLISSFGVELVDDGTRTTGVDCHAALWDLPAFFETTTKTVPATIPYLTVPTEIRAGWRERMASGLGLKIGLNWAGNPDSPVEKFRRVPLAEFQMIAEIPDIAWYSLQKGAPSTDHSTVPNGFNLVDTGAAPLAETAGLITELDLVVTSDTAVAHLAAALGKPTWVLLHAAPDWRWGLTGADCDWYPTVRLFRQPRLGDWSAVAADLDAALREFAAAKMIAHGK